MTPFDSVRFRTACGTFPTGVAIVTTQGSNGRAVGLTINSFVSLSLDPPLVLWNLSTSSSCHADFAAAQYFAIHVLHIGQEHLSRRFANRQIDKFTDLPLEDGIGGIPILADYHARLQCQLKSRMDGGDHSIIIGQVANIEVRECEPLVFFRGRYRSLQCL